MMQRYHIVINAGAGALQGKNPEDLQAALRQSLDGLIESLTLVPGDRVASTIDTILTQKPAPVLIGGGDGTIASAAAVTLRHGQAIGILPLGTMNLLAGDLDMTAALPTLIDGFRQPVSRSIDAGRVDERLFLCSAVIGVVPDASIKREALRHNHSFTGLLDFAGGLFDGLAGHHPQHLVLQCNGEEMTVDVAALVISNNAFLPVSAHKKYRRGSLTGGQLAVYGIQPHGMVDSARLLLKLWDGAWHEDDTVFSFTTPTLTVTAAAADMLVSLDGEPVSLSASSTFTCHPGALPMLVPGDNA